MHYDSNNLTGLDASPLDPHGLNGFGSFCAYNIDLWIRNDELAHSMWQAHKHHLGQFTARTARATALSIFGEKTPHNVKIRNRAIDWREIASVWNSYQQ